ncbi:hypothetical protein EYR40_008314 [Pleurotus pulmonarius]|nr:hypothetical protein EYR40_008314 [Pleurotus pulmonarius]
MTNSATSTPPPRSPTRSPPNTNPSSSPCALSLLLPYNAPTNPEPSYYRKSNSNGALKRKAEAVESDDADADSEDDLHEQEVHQRPHSSHSARSKPPSKSASSPSSNININTTTTANTTKSAHAKSAAGGVKKEKEKEEQVARNEYQDGHIVCEGCKRQVPFRDDGAQGEGGFTVRLWENHLKTWYHRHGLFTNTNTPTINIPYTNAFATLPAEGAFAFEITDGDDTHREGQRASGT